MTQEQEPENPLQPTPWSEWRRLEDGGLERRRIGNFGQDMTEILRGGYWSTITESFADAKRFFHTYAGPPLPPDEQEFINFLRDIEIESQLPKIPLEFRVYWDAEGSDSVLFTDLRNYTASVAIDNTAEALIVKLGKPEDFNQNEVLNHQADVTLTYRRSHLQSCTIDRFNLPIVLRFFEEGIVAGWRELSNIPEEDRSIEDYMSPDTPAGRDAWYDSLTGSKYSNKFYRYGEEFSVNSQVMEVTTNKMVVGVNRVLIVSRDGNICGATYKREGEQQQCIATFPLEIPQEQVTATLNDPRADFRKIRPLVPVSFRRF